MKRILWLAFSLSICVVANAQDSTSMRSNGFFIDGTLSIGSNDYFAFESFDGNLIGTTGIRLGTKYFVKSHQDYSVGMNVHWISQHFVLNYVPHIVASPLQIGFSNVWRKGDEYVFELNFNGGVSFIFEEGFLGNNYGTGFQLNPEFLWRKGRFRNAIGYRYSYYSVAQFGYYNPDRIARMHEVVLSLGLHQK